MSLANLIPLSKALELKEGRVEIYALSVGNIGKLLGEHKEVVEQVLNTITAASGKGGELKAGDILSAIPKLKNVLLQTPGIIQTLLEMTCCPLDDNEKDALKNNLSISSQLTILAEAYKLSMSDISAAMSMYTGNNKGGKAQGKGSK